jgi:riboflavin synthase
MFTGLVADIGTVEIAERDRDGARLRIATELASDLAGGDSVAVSGVCLTVAANDGSGFEAEVMNQTLSVTSLGGLESGGRVNLEPALRASDRLGGHIVQGHVDGVAELEASEPDGFARRLRVAIPAELRRYVIEHGSVAVEGVSLTVSKLTDSGFAVSLIPETLERTTLGAAEPGAPLNLEVDVLARYTERLLQGFNERKTV